MTFPILPQAEQDLIEILAYGIQWDEKLAESMYLKITEQLETLYFSPNRTKKKKGSLGTREMLISDSPYRAIIQIDEDAKRVFILRILHTSRNI